MRACQAGVVDLVGPVFDAAVGALSNEDSYVHSAGLSLCRALATEFAGEALPKLLETYVGASDPAVRLRAGEALVLAIQARGVLVRVHARVVVRGALSVVSLSAGDEEDQLRCSGLGVLAAVVTAVGGAAAEAFGRDVVDVCGACMSDFSVRASIEARRAAVFCIAALETAFRTSGCGGSLRADGIRLLRRFANDDDEVIRVHACGGLDSA